jgi:hypothetical protein
MACSLRRLLRGDMNVLDGGGKKIAESVLKTKYEENNSLDRTLINLMQVYSYCTSFPGESGEGGRRHR